MNRILADTSYLVAHFNEDDVHHKKALQVQDRFMSGEWAEIMLIAPVFFELMAVLMNRRSYAYAKEVGETLRSGEEIQWVYSDGIMDAAWHEFLAQPGERLSLADCALVAAADRFGIQDVATFDEGFDRIPRIRRIP